MVLLLVLVGVVGIVTTATLRADRVDADLDDMHNRLARLEESVRVGVSESAASPSE